MRAKNVRIGRAHAIQGTVQKSGRSPSARAALRQRLMAMKQNTSEITKLMAAGTRLGQPRTEAAMPHSAQAHHMADVRAIDR